MNVFNMLATVEFNFDEVKIDPQRVSNAKPFTNKYNWGRKITHQK